MADQTSEREKLWNVTNVKRKTFVLIKPQMESALILATKCRSATHAPGWESVSKMKTTLESFSVRKRLKMYKIDKNIEIPPFPKRKMKNANKRQTYPFKNMEIGDSFLVPLPSGCPGIAHCTTVKIHNARRMNNNPQLKNRKFSTRTVKEGVRCWRIK